MKYKIDNFGLAGYVIQKTKDGLFIATKDFLNSDNEPYFSKFLEAISGEILSKSKKLINPHQINNLLVTINENNQATVIINKIDIDICGFINSEAVIGQTIDINSMPHISYVNIKGA